MTKQATEKRAPERPLSAIGWHVLHNIGQPDGLQRVQVRHLWEACYRVNVFAGVDFLSARIIRSYFVVADDAGAIVSSMPPLVKTYSPATVDSAAGVIYGAD